MIGILAGDTGQRFRCSRTSCVRDASWAIRWRNPKIHREDRYKVWLSCDEHRDYLHGFLTTRSFPVTLLPITEYAASGLRR